MFTFLRSLFKTKGLPVRSIPTCVFCSAKKDPVMIVGWYEGCGKKVRCAFKCCDEWEEKW